MIFLMMVMMTMMIMMMLAVASRDCLRSSSDGALRLPLPRLRGACLVQLEEGSQAIRWLRTHTGSCEASPYSLEEGS